MQTHVLATFTRRPDADAALEELNRRYPWARARIGDREDALDALALGQRDEVAEGLMTGPTGLMTGPMARGALLWGSAGLVVGAVLGAVAALGVSSEGMAFGAYVLFFALAGAIAASVTAAVLGAGRQVVKEGETTPEDPTAVVRADADAEQADELIHALAASGARTARFVDHRVSRLASSEVEAPRARSGGRLAADERSTSDAGFRPGDDVR